MKLSRNTLAAVLAGSLLAGSGAALAFGGQGMGMGMGMGTGGCNNGGGPMGALYQLDDLTGEQREKLDQLRKEQRSEMRKLGDSMRETHRDLRDAADDGADQKTVQALAEKSGTQMTAMILSRTEAKRKVDAILTEKQRKELQGVGPAGFGPGPGCGGSRSGW
ncbi:MAG: hypothetical protein A2286_05930 [Gammaproteobacteria bacterium RIFOXYA12_FULL_61_12]|nr:MAG: hypothetical protein A2514_04395 [Gammaproteobacteria bacterium RIFOXYD12_FULL_61_37]OGT94545.1 MAG: hypothetical protein A2286_05930 [Gammaproteobacteria bacterium RIFOXYA12_FULL_61_12]